MSSASSSTIRSATSATRLSANACSLAFARNSENSERLGRAGSRLPALFLFRGHNRHMKKRIASFASLVAVVLCGVPITATADAFEVAIDVDAGRAGDELTPIWRFFGADEPNYA